MEPQGSGEDGMRPYLSAIVMLVVLCGLAVTGRAKIAEKQIDLPGIVAVPPAEFQAIRASVVNKNPANYTIDVRKLANIGADEDAPYFAVYLTNTLPPKCGDFRTLDLNYSKPAKYKRAFDLSAHPEVLKAIRAYGCVVMRNIPPAA